MVKLVRVDDRFIHGQILESWIPHLDAEVVIVVNDVLAADSFQKTIMSLALPDRIELQIIPVAEIGKYLGGPEYSDRSILVITSNIIDAYKIYRGGVSFGCLNVGNMGCCEGGRQFSYSVWIDPAQIEMIRQMLKDGLEVIMQTVPRESGVGMGSVIDMESN